MLALQLLTLLLEKPTDDSVEVAVGFFKEVGMKLTEVSPKGVNGECGIGNGKFNPLAAGD